MPNFVIVEMLTSHIKEIKEICKKNDVKSLFAFGSIVKNNLSYQSDIDLVVEIDNQDPITYSDYYFNIKFALEQLLQRPIDLLEQKAINNPLLKSQIELTKVLVYGI